MRGMQGGQLLPVRAAACLTGLGVGATSATANPPALQGWKRQHYTDGLHFKKAGNSRLLACLSKGVALLLA